LRVTTTLGMAELLCNLKPGADAWKAAYNKHDAEALANMYDAKMGSSRTTASRLSNYFGLDAQKSRAERPLTSRRRHTVAHSSERKTMEACMAYQASEVQVGGYAAYVGRR
jgi:hypothetical protein